MKHGEESINIPVWWRSGGGMMVRRDGLPDSHPECTYNYVKNIMKKVPEDYGIYTQRQEFIRNELKPLSKEELMNRLCNALEEIEAYQKAGF